MFKESWIQEVASSIQLAPLNNEVAKKTTTLTENQIRRVAGLAQKFHRRSRQSTMSMDHINLALSTQGLEEVYGLTSTPGAVASATSLHKRKLETKGDEDLDANPVSVAATAQGLVNLVEIGHQFALQPPNLPEMALHWLAIDGVQPVIPENPPPSVLKLNSSLVQKNLSLETAQRDQHNFPTLLSQEMQNFYHRCTTIISTGAPSAPGGPVPPVGEVVSAAGVNGNGVGGDGLNIANSPHIHTQSIYALCHVFQTCTGLQELLPYLAQFFCSQISANIDSNVSVLWNTARVIAALVQNPNVRLEFHIQQLLPALLSTIVGAKVGTSSADEQQWGLRRFSAGVVNLVCSKYTVFIPDLTARICKTYVDCFQSHRELTTVFGGVVGLSALGYTFIRSALLPKLSDIRAILETSRGKLASCHGSARGDGAGSVKAHKVLRIKVQQCDSALIAGLGIYLTECMLLPSASEVAPSLAAGAKRVAATSSAEPLIDTDNIEELKQRMQQMHEELQRIKTAQAADGGADMSGGKSRGEKRRQAEARARLAICSYYEEVLADYAEVLVPYYAQCSESLDHCRLWI